MNVAITFTPDGQGRCLHTDAIDLRRLGRLSVQRATTIEFDDHAQCWIVRDRTGFDMYHSPSRQTCLEWERQYLESQEDQEHELYDCPGAAAAGV